MRILICLILILPFGASAQVLNGDFETWTGTLYNSVYAGSLPAQNPQWSTTTPDNWTQSDSQCRVDDSYTGNFGMLCYTYYGYIPGWISYTDYSTNRPDFLSGYYKYLLGGANYNNAFRYAEVTVWSNGDTIGTSLFNFDTTSTYTYFQSAINYTSNQAPDSLNIYIYTLGGGPQIVNGFLFLDNIDLIYNSVGLENTDQKTPFKVYPNPVKNDLYIDYDKKTSFGYAIFNLQGELILSGSLQNRVSSIPMIDFTSGIYIIKIKDETGESIIKITKE
jgi:hypothetical protein